MPLFIREVNKRINSHVLRYGYLFHSFIFFIFTNAYQKRNGGEWDASLKLSLYNGIVSMILAAIVGGFQLEVTLFSFVIALIYAIMRVVFSFVSIKALRYTNLSIYSMLSMLGGMVFPFLYGILFCEEECSWLKIISCLLIVVSLYLTIEKGKKEKGVLKYYVGVFVLNGMFGILSKFHQMNTKYSIDSESFTILIRFCCIVICVAGILLKGYSLKIDRKSVLCCLGGSSFNTIANLMLLVALLHIQASVQYPIVTGGVVLFSTVASFFQKKM